MKTETPREIAERLAQNFNYAFRGSYVPSAYRDATTAIEVALNAERERCAKIAERTHLTKYFDVDLREEVGAEIAAAIRGSKD